mmetsp:Transcript_18788/g.47110  ORF Transcript_18788/g.47110 Transcript_18788/m.47110 type:complete len:262 (-) Transcript_18788:37-822(-)
MGCCCSSPEGTGTRRSEHRSHFDARQWETVEDVVYKARCQGPRAVHVVGRVIHTGEIYEAPFSRHQCVMVTAAVYQSDTKKPSKKKPPKIVASGAHLLGFKLFSTIDGRTHELVIEPGVWEMKFESTGTFQDVRMNKEKNMLVCKDPDSRKKLRELPKGKEFWDGFIHPIGPTAVEVPDVKDKTWKGSLDVHEFALREGDAVAVLGRVKVVDNEVVIEAGGKSIAMITNKRSLAHSLLSCPAGVTNVVSKPQVVPYRQATE